MSPVITRTLNPLPFEHLEPKRFEDLARQLAYDFRTWRQLEATGRTGSDAGFDARGFEITTESAADLRLSDDEQDIAPETAGDRLWLIQCKRERTIRPAQMRAHLEAIPPESREGLDGVLFVAACDFSLATRDVLRLWCSTNGISECHIWGKAEIEDLLYQPKNDNLLFAYFGISLQIRQRKLSTAIRRTTTLKRKLKRLFPDEQFRGYPAIIRDISDDRYPYSGGNLEDSDCLWRVVYIKGLGIKGLRILLKDFFAFYDEATGHWDVATKENHAVPHDHENPWAKQREYSPEPDHAHELWMSLPERQQYNAQLITELSYDDIIEIDDIGDQVSIMPTIYVNFVAGKMPAIGGADFIFEPVARFAQKVRPEHANHVRLFPDPARDLDWERRWAARCRFELSTEPFVTALEVPPWLLELQRKRAEPSTE